MLSEPREDWDMNRDGGGAWEGQTRRVTCAERIREAAQRAGQRAREVFGRKHK